MRCRACVLFAWLCFFETSDLISPAQNSDGLSRFKGHSTVGIRCMGSRVDNADDRRASRGADL
jgi:hypothetical protein